MEEFEGKVIVYADSYGHKYEGYIAGCDYDIGITIVNNEDKEDYLYCLKGPSYDSSIEDNDYYKESFENAIAMFKDGFFDRRIDVEIDKKYGKTGGNNAGPHTCAFNK